MTIRLIAAILAILFLVMGSIPFTADREGYPLNKLGGAVFIFAALLFAWGATA